MTYIIHGATGAQGSPVLAALVSANRSVRAAVRNTDNVPAGVDAVAVDLTDSDALAAIYAGSEGVFVHLPLGAPDQVHAQVAAIAAAITTALPARVVISTSGAIVDQPGSHLQAPESSPIATLIRDITATGVSTAVVAPRLYLENLMLPVIAGPAADEGVLRYPLQDSFAVSWSSHLDVADVAVRLLIDSSVTGTVAVGHLPGITGPRLAAAFAEHLGRDVRFEDITPAQFGEMIAPIFGPDATAPVVGLYQALGAESANVIAASNSAQRLLGITPRPVPQWLRELSPQRA